MRNLFGLLCVSALVSAPALAQVSVSIGIDVPAYPDLRPIPGYPVYYAPQMSTNYFFYDGAYWVYASNGWHTSDWYNGPWDSVDPYQVPEFVLRIPVRYYRQPPPAFRGWSMALAPRWGNVWGADWTRRRQGWDHWDRQHVPQAAPLPRYQHDYGHERYPGAGAREQIHQQNYHYQGQDRHDYRDRAPEVQVRQVQDRGHPAAPEQHGQAQGAAREHGKRDEHDNRDEGRDQKERKEHPPA
ncbi:MAG: hypothetical protein V4463_00050 [Pseudomonadota bacterium]